MGERAHAERALATEDHQELIIEGRHFLLHGGDSALVIMVQVLPNDLPRVVTTTHIRSAAIPESFWSKSWTSGDTTYFVHPHYPESVRMLRSALLESPAAAEFLR